MTSPAFRPHCRTCRVPLTALACATGLLLLGCAQRRDVPADLPPLMPCTIEVTWNAAPLASATVTVLPETGRWVGVGQTDGAGRAVILTHGRYAGLPAGRYRVEIKAYALEGEPVAPATTAEEDAARTAAGVREPTRRSLIPDRFAAAETSGLTITVGDSPVLIPLDLGR
jgi:hypothetical protein